VNNFCVNLKYKFCINDIALLRKEFKHKICFKKKYEFLNLKVSPSMSIANRLMKQGKFLKIYKFFKRYYYTFMLRKQFKKIPLSSNFLFFFNKYNSFRDLDRVLF
jgi:hypothetical protein